MNRLGRWFGLFGRGVWHFVVGDTPEFLPAVAAVVGVALALRSVHLAEWLVLPVMVVVVLVASLLRSSRVRRSP